MRALTLSCSESVLPEVIYMDNAATSWPKPQEVAAAMTEFLSQKGGNPGRSGHRLSIAAGRVVLEAREAVASLFGLDDPFRVIFTLNATHALNIALFGLLEPGDRVLTTAMEHNSVMRPLRALQQRGVEVITVPCHSDGFVDIEAFKEALSRRTKAICIQHASNVTGTIQPIAELSAQAREAGAVTIVDAAQTAGAVPIDLRSLPVDLLAFTGHKALLGPPGTGGLVISPTFPTDRLRPLLHGGTGSRSEFEEQPAMLPDRFEAGTPNGVGLAGLAAGVKVVQNDGVETIRQREIALVARLLEGLGSIPRVTVYGPERAEKRTPCISINIEGLRPDEVGLLLDEDFGILTRVGLHCAPAAHRTLGTFPTGTIRIAPGFYTTPSDIDRVVEAVRYIADNAQPEEIHVL